MRPKDSDRNKVFKVSIKHTSIMESMINQGLADIPYVEERNILSRVGKQTGAFSLWTSDTHKEKKARIIREKPIKILYRTYRYLFCKVIE